MKKLLYYLAIGLFIVGCSSTTKTTKTDKQLPEGAVRIANEELEYEIIIIDIGFESYLQTIAKPANYYSQSSQVFGGGLSLAGGGFSMSKLAKTASKVADVALPLVSAMGYDTTRASRVKKVMDGGGQCDDSVQGGGTFGIGKKTQRKIKKNSKKKRENRRITYKRIR